jgi:uncharacterized membrane protein
MQLKNPLKMNDWKFKELLAVVFGIQFSLLILIGLDSLGLDISLVRQVIGFIYLAFIPGILLLRIFKIHRLSNVEALLYVSGLSIATVMFVGLLANTFLLAVSVGQPISTLPLLAIMTATVVGLCILAFVRDKDFSLPSFIETRGVVSPPLLFLCIIPFVSIAGARLVDISGNNSLSLLLFVLLAVIPLLIVFDKIPHKLYPLAVFVTAIALLYDVTIVSQYLTGFDVQIEYFFADAVSTSGVWNTTISNDYSSMLSVSILPPIIGSICNLSIVAAFKVIYQFFFALVPLGLYLAYQKQTNDRTAFLSAYYFVSIFVFYAVMTELMKQEIAELFVVLLILLIIEKKMKSVARSFLFIIFGFGLAVSHYGLSYLYIAILILAVLLAPFVFPAARGAHSVRDIKTREHRRSRSLLNSIKLDQIAGSNAIPIVFVLLFIVLAFSWYTFTASSAPLFKFADVLRHGFSNLLAIFSAPQATPIGIATTPASSAMREITLYLSEIAEFFIVVGFVRLIQKPRERSFTKGYFSLICANFAVLLVGIALPLLFQWDTLRAYQIALIVLAPLFVIGAMVFFGAVARIARLPFTKKTEKACLTILAIFLAIFLLFNSGWIYAITNDNPTQFALSSQIDAPRFNEQEVLAAQWMESSRLNGTVLYGDDFGTLLLDSVAGPQNPQTFYSYTTFASNTDALILFRSTNLDGRITMSTGYASMNDSLFYQNSIVKSNLVYDNGRAQVYHP